MTVVAIVAQKGGAGKTTLATNLAWTMAEDAATLLLDSDRQASSRNWAAGAALPDNLVVQGVTGRDLVREVTGVASGFEWVLIDCPPGITRTSGDAVLVADVVLMPVQPSPLDVWAAADIVTAVKARQATARGRPVAAFVIMMAQPRTRMSRQIEDALNEMEIPVLQGRTTRRVAYPTAINDGNSVVVGRDRVARDEVLAIKQGLEGLADDH